MTKEEKLELVSKAIDKGFDIELSLHSGGTKEEAEAKMKEFASTFTQPYEFCEDPQGRFQWYKVQEYNPDIELDEQIELAVFIGE